MHIMDVIEGIEDSLAFISHDELAQVYNTLVDMGKFVGKIEPDPDKPGHFLSSERKVD